MTATPHETLISCLREEIACYGGLLALFEQQQELLLRPNPGKILEMTESIEGEARSASTVRQRREHLVEAAASAAGRSGSPLRELLDVYPEPIRPLLGALIDEINRLIQRVRRRARQNQEMLGRMVDIHRETLRALRPDLFGATYGVTGVKRTGAASGMLQAAG